VRSRLDHYRELWRGPGPLPRLGVLRTVVVADSDAEALAIAREPFREHYMSLTKLWRERNMDTVSETFTPDIEEDMRDDKAYVGSPATVRDKLREFFDKTDCEYLIIRPMFGNLPFEHAFYSLQLFIHEVMPALSAAQVGA
jgi:alkanesulfonate monooxygenase SsuD/methylene tetrahydromethanopterin reductase-like flavin-dependent oxidoreductase (luciferase family)